MRNYIDAVIENLSTEIARRQIGFDRHKLKPFETLPIEELVIPHPFPEGEFIRAYLMRHREETGEELTVADMEDTTIVI
jgi:hypothetical protein